MVEMFPAIAGIWSPPYSDWHTIRDDPFPVDRLQELSAMTKIPGVPREDDVSLRKQATPPKPFAKQKPKLRPGAPATKAEHAALKRPDKTVIKRMRKR